MRFLCERCGALAEGRIVARPGGAAVACGSCGAESPLPAADAAPPPSAAPAPAGPAPAGPDAAWAELRARWDDPGAHRRFIDGHADLAALARAGARYREALAERPGDAAALRGRDEVLRRATALGLAAVPRTAPPRLERRGARRMLLALLAGLLVGGAAWTAIAALRLAGRR